MKNLSRKFFNENISNSKVLKALELFLFVKVHYQSSTIKYFSYKHLSEVTGLCFTTLKKRMAILRELELIEFVGKNKNHLLFKSLRGKKSNINIEALDFSSIKTIEDGLRALFLVQIQVRKEYIKQLLLKYKNPSKGEDYKEIRREVRKRGLMDTQFKDYGISYKYIAKKLKIGFNKVSKLIECAEKIGLLIKEKHSNLVYDAKCDGVNGYYAFEFVPESNKKGKFATNRGIYSVEANTYHLCHDVQWYGI